MTNFNLLNPVDKRDNTTGLNSSGMALSYFPNPEQVRNERESLQRIHTFSLKEPTDMNGSDE